MTSPSMPHRGYRTLLRRIATRWGLAAALALGLTTGAALGQTVNPVYVDDSPRAAELLRLARTQAEENAGEAVRLYQELLDEYGRKLVPRRSQDADHFADVRLLVLDELRRDGTLLDRYVVAQEGEALRLLDAGALEALVASRSLTGPGLVALMSLGQEAMESAHFEAALDLLDEALAHPALTPQDAVSAWLMRGTSAHFLGRTAQVQEALAQLAAMPDAGAHAAQLQRTIDGGAGPEHITGVTPMDAPHATEQQELVAQEIWFEPLPGSLLNRRFPDRPGAPPSPGYEARNRSADFTTAAPTTAGQAVYVNEGHVVRALDRYTGRPLWPFPYEERTQSSVSDRDADATGDMNLITISGDWLVTLTGHAQARRRTGDGKVLCLSRATGQPRWARSLDRLGGDDEFTDLFAHGRPLIVEGRVIVLARKISRQSVTGSYIVALDLATGELEWVRHIASSGGRHRTGRPFASPLEDRGDILVATAVGAVACLDARSGAVRWLRRAPVPVHDTTSRERRPWELRSLVVHDEKVIALAPDDARILVLDRASGELIASHDATSMGGWANPSYLLAGDHHVYGIGESIRAFSPAALDFPVWQVPPPPQSSDDEEIQLAVDLKVAGRVQLAGDMLIVPTQRAVLAVDADTGAVMHELEIGNGGNPVAAEGQLIVASGNELDAYMSFARAASMLRERIAGDPTDPEPALSLVQLATRVEDFQLVMEAADLAVSAIDRPENRGNTARRVEARRELFELLLARDTGRLARDEDDGEALHALLGTVASGPDERVEHLIAYSDWLAERRPAAAVEPLQRILSDPLLRSTVRSDREDAVLRVTEHWACERLGRLVARHGAAVYAPIADMARTRLDAVAAGPGRMDALMAIAMEFPLAPAGLEAAVIAAEEARAAGRPRTALACLSRAYQLAPDRNRAAALMGRFVAYCIADEHRAAARETLAALLARHGELTLETGTGARVATQWAETLRTRAARAPRVGMDAGEPVRLAGELVRVEPGGHLPPDMALLQEGATLRRIDPVTLRTAWSAKLESPRLRVLDTDARSILLWIDERDDPRIIALDRNDGSIRWSTPFLGDHVEAPLAQERPIAERMPDQKTFDPKEVLPRRGPETLYLIQRTGGLAAFDPDDGRAVLWARDRTMEQVHIAIAHPLGLVLIGADRRLDAGAATTVPEPRILVLDPARGTILHDLRPNTSSGVIWATMDGLGGLACAATEGIEMVDIVTGERRWTNVAYDLGDTNPGWPLGDRLLVRTRTNSLLTTMDASGRKSGPFDISPRGDWDPLELEEVILDGDRLLARFTQRIVRYDLDGNVLGADVVDEDRNFRWLLPAEEGLVVVSLAEVRQRADPDRRRRERESVYAIYRLSDSCRIERPPVAFGPLGSRVVEARLIDGWVLLSTTDDETIALPIPAES